MSAQIENERVSTLVATRSNAEDVFEEFGIDYWFGGEHTLREACASARVDRAAVEARLFACPPCDANGQRTPEQCLKQLNSEIDTVIRPTLISVRNAARDIVSTQRHELQRLIDSIDATVIAHQAIASRRGALEQRAVRQLALQHALLAYRVKKLVELSSRIGRADLQKAVSKLAHELHHHIRLSYEGVMPEMFERTAHRPVGFGAE